MSTAPVTLDLSKSVPLDPPPGGVTLDMSKSVPLNAPSQEPPHPVGAWEQLGAGLSAAGEANPGNMLPPGAGSVISGVAKAGAETVHGVAKLLHMTGEEPESLKPQGGLEHVGAAIENVAEFAAGDEALKALSVADKLKMISGVSEAMQKFPILAKMLGGAARTGLVSGVQQTAKAGDLAQGAMGAATGAALGGVAGAMEGAASLAPTAEAVEGTAIPKLASQAADATPEAKLAEKVASPGKIASFKEGQNVAGQQAIKSMAGNVTKEISGKVGDKLVTTAGSFTDAANKVRDVAKPIFAKLDEVSDGEFSTLQNREQSARRALYNAQSTVAVDDAQNELNNIHTATDKLIEKSGKDMDTNDFRAAQVAWRKSKALDKLGAIVDKSFDVKPGLAEGTSAENQMLNGRKLLTGLGNRIKTSELKDALGDNWKERQNDLVEIGHLLTTPKTAQKFSELTTALVSGFGAHAIGASGLGGVATGAGALTARQVVGMVMTNPKAARALVFAVKGGASTDIAVPTILSMLRASGSGASQ